MAESERNRSKRPASTPALTIACFCEKAIKQANGYYSLISVIDKFAIVSPHIDNVKSKPDEVCYPPEITLVVALHSLSAEPIKCRLKITATSPSGRSHVLNNEKLEFLNRRSNVVLIGVPPIFAAEEGHHEYAVELNNKEITRISLEIFHQQPQVEKNKKKKTARKATEPQKS